MKLLARLLPSLILVALAATPLAAQHAPRIGYMFPSGGQPGTTVDVVLGGYDWTPDMQVFVLQPGVTLEITGEPSPVIVPEPPYWFGRKARRPPDPLPREFPARLTIGKDVPPGVVLWQAANANGICPTGKFHVGTLPELVEVRHRKSPQSVEKLPSLVSGQILKIAEVDEYTFRATKDGPITLTLFAGQIASPLTAVLEVRDSSGRIVKDAADTQGEGTALTFRAAAGQEYKASLYDADFRGDRSFVYRLSIAEVPQVLAAIPPAVVRGTKQPVEFVGYGIATGADKLESVNVEVAVPAEKNVAQFAFELETPFGKAAPLHMPLVDAADLPGAGTAAAQELSALPAARFGVFDESYGEHRYSLAGKKGDIWSIAATSQRAVSPLDLSLAVFDEQGVEKRRVEDLAGSVDTAMEFVVPADGVYQISVSDNSPNSGDRAAVYRLDVSPGSPGFELAVPELLPVPLGGTAALVIKATRTGGFVEPISIKLDGLPPGVTVPAEVLIPAKQAQARVDFTAAADAAALAALVNVSATATVGERTVSWQSPQPLLVASLIKPPFSIEAEGRDDVTKWPRGTTFPGPVLIEREEGFVADIRLEQTSKQGRHVMGITGPEVIVPVGVSRALYPVTLPEWLETTRTSRMELNGVALVKDPQGNMRHSLVRLKSRIGFLPTGALLKLSSPLTELEVAPGQPIEIPLAISRDRSLPQPLTLELIAPEELADDLQAAPVTLNADVTEAVFRIEPVAGKVLSGEHHITVRATVLQSKDYPVVSEATVLVVFPETRAVAK